MDDILREERVVEFGFVEGNVRLRVDDIIYIETSKHKNVFYTVGETYSIYRKMDELEAELAGMGFVRIHQSFLINILVIELMQGILEKGELLRESALASQKKESQPAHYRDMQAVYERQGRKMHDYKNQIRTMQVLLKNLKDDPLCKTIYADNS